MSNEPPALASLAQCVATLPQYNGRIVAIRFLLVK